MTTTDVIKKSIGTYKAACRLEKYARRISKEQMNEIRIQALKEKELEEVSDLIKNGKEVFKKIVPIIMAAIALFCIVIMFVSIPMNLHDEFERDMVKIAPYIEEQEVKELKSKWVCMRSRDAYEEIYAIIDEIEEKFDLPN